MAGAGSMKPLAARRVVVGPGPDGSGRLLSDTACRALGPGAMGDHAVDLAELWRLEEVLRSSKDGGDPAQDPWQMIPRPGGAALRLVRWRASSPGMHRTDTLDWLFILDGRIELEYEHGRVRLETGDTVVIQDAIHCWHLIDGTPCTALAVMLRPAPSD